jgi:hypothetical protein
MDVPPDVQERLRGRLASFRGKIGQRPPSRLPLLWYSLVHPSWVRVAATAAVVGAVVVAALFLLPRSDASRAYAAAVAQLSRAQSLEYTVVLAPYTEVSFSYLVPGYRRVDCSWGMELRTDGSGKQLILIPATRHYLIEEGKPSDSLADAMNLVEQLKSLPKKPGEILGEQTVGDKRLRGYRVHQLPRGNVIQGLKALDVWVDERGGSPDHVDISIQEAGKPLYQMHIKDIRVDAKINPSQFDMTPPAGYTEIQAPGGGAITVQPKLYQDTWWPVFKQSEPLFAVVIPMTGSYQQTPVALHEVESYLKKLGVAPVGPPFGRYESEQHWDAGYPVPATTHVEAPFKFISLPATWVASVAVKGPWGEDSTGRWGIFLRRVLEKRYVPSGPPMEIWSGKDAQPGTQSTEMRIAVAKTN